MKKSSDKLRFERKKINQIQQCNKSLYGDSIQITDTIQNRALTLLKRKKTKIRRLQFENEVLKEKMDESNCTFHPKLTKMARESTRTLKDLINWKKAKDSRRARKEFEKMIEFEAEIAQHQIKSRAPRNRPPDGMKVEDRLLASLQIKNKKLNLQREKKFEGLFKPQLIQTRRSCKANIIVPKEVLRFGYQGEVDPKSQKVEEGKETEEYLELETKIAKSEQKSLPKKFITDNSINYSIEYSMGKSFNTEGDTLKNFSLKKSKNKKKIYREKFYKGKKGNQSSSEIFINSNLTNLTNLTPKNIASSRRKKNSIRRLRFTPKQEFTPERKKNEKKTILRTPSSKKSTGRRVKFESLYSEERNRLKQKKLNNSSQSERSITVSIEFDNSSTSRPISSRRSSAPSLTRSQRKKSIKKKKKERFVSSKLKKRREEAKNSKNKGQIASEKKPVAKIRSRAGSRVKSRKNKITKKKMSNKKKSRKSLRNGSAAAKKKPKKISSKSSRASSKSEYLEVECVSNLEQSVEPKIERKEKLKKNIPIEKSPNEIKHTKGTLLVAKRKKSIPKKNLMQERLKKVFKRDKLKVRGTIKNKKIIN